MHAKIHALIKQHNASKYPAVLRQHILRKRNWPIFICALIPLAILAPLLGRGYILQYDMVFTPYVHIDLDSIREGIGLYQSLPVRTLLKLASFILPMDIVQKILLFSIFFLSSYGMYRSVPRTAPSARLIAGLLYAINPFTYDRLMAGHWLFLMAYALTPLAVRSFYVLLTEPRRRQLVIALSLWALIVLINAHHLVILGLLFVCMAIFIVRSVRQLLYVFGLLTAVLLINLWWLIPALTVPNFTNAFNLNHLYAFASKADPAYGIWFNLLSLQGFWYTSWQSIKDIFTFWPLLIAVWLLPAFIGLGGMRTCSAGHRRLLYGLLLASVLAIILAAGPHPSVWAVNSWIFNNVPGFSGMRESQKFLALLAVTYAFLTAYGLDTLLRSAHKKIAVTALGISTAAILAAGFPLLWAANGQMRLEHYPASWHHFYRILENDREAARAIVLPWELYVEETFVDRLVANPAKAFYGERVVQSQRTGLPGVDMDEAGPRGHQLVYTAITRKDFAALRQAMAAVNASYIMLTETRRPGEYDWLINRPDIHVVIQDPQLMVIRLTKR